MAEPPGRPAPRPIAAPAVTATLDRHGAWFDELDEDPRLRRRWDIIDGVQVELVRRCTTRCPDARVLELGCGRGRLLAKLGARHRVGLEIGPFAIGEARRRLPAEVLLVRADAHRLPFADASFEVLVSGDGVFGQLDYPRAFAECVRVLGPRGHLAFHQYAASTRTLEGLWAWMQGQPHPQDPGHVRRLDDVVGPARATGLEVVSTHLWRSIRVPPYALPLPLALAGTRLWSHVTFVLRKV